MFITLGSQIIQIGEANLMACIGINLCEITMLIPLALGQHVTLLPDGKFVTGRDFGKTPASIQGYNTGAFAVEMLGNFDIGNDKFEGPQKESMIKLARYFYSKGCYIRFHRENAPKTCPGTSIDKNEFMKEVMGMAENIVKTPILGTPMVTLEQARAWAQKRGAHQRFIDVAEWYWYYGDKTGIRPEVLYAQAAKETALGILQFSKT